MEEFACQIRWAKPSQWKETMDMVWSTFLKFEAGDYTEEGIRNFYDFITDEELRESFLKGEYRMMVALDKEKIVGMASVRNRHHLSLLFVDENYHRKGIGSALLKKMCEYLKNEEGERVMTLTAAPYAVDFYRYLGFSIVRPEEQVAGIRITSMEKIL